tara:strand:+ start:249 stop:662 length:414 start_codon:yes stop_codon:yes gene_type:complete
VEDSRSESGEVGREKAVRRIYGALPAFEEVEKGDEEDLGSSPPPARNENTSKKEQPSVYLRGRAERITYRALTRKWVSAKDAVFRARIGGLGDMRLSAMYSVLQKLEIKGLVEKKAARKTGKVTRWVWRKTKLTKYP